MARRLGELKLIADKAQNIFIAAMWRSGSTHLSNALCGALGFRPRSTVGVNGQGDEEQVIQLHAGQVLFPYGGQVFQQHTKATGNNTQILGAFENTKILVTHRNIFDVLVSLEEQSKRFTAIPGLYMPNRSIRNRMRWLAHFATPWICEFEASWMESYLPHLDVQYEEFFSDQIGGLKKIFEFIGVESPSDEVLQFHASEKVNFYKGVSGRGEKIPEEIKKIALDVIDSYENDELRRRLLCLD